jgi:hypothetical protein|tara:strand:+ start:2102 stop:2479 length:378 start_codon:yes stop_codon:yes gene_type:complete
MNFFQLQNKLFYSDKSKSVEFLDSEGEQAFVPFLLNRWLTMYSKQTVSFVNDTLNKYCGVFDTDKQKTYRLYYNLIPRLKFKRINYIKKVKKDKAEQEDLDQLKLIARNKNISVRELKMYRNLLD